MKKSITVLCVVVLLVALLTVLVGCNFIQGLIGKVKPDTENENNEALATPTLSYADGHLSWTDVSGADAYRIQYVDAAGKAQSKTATSPQDVYQWGLATGVYEMRVRAEDSTGKRADSAYSNAVSVSIKTRCSLSNVAVSVFFVTQNMTLVQCDPIEGAASYRVVWGGSSYVSDDPALLIQHVDATKDAAFTFDVTGDATHEFVDGPLALTYSAKDADKVESLSYDKADDSLTVAVLDAKSVVVDGTKIAGASLASVRLEADVLAPLSVGFHYMEIATELSVKRYALEIKDTRPLRFVNAKGDTIDEVSYNLARSDLRLQWKMYSNTLLSVSIDGTVWEDSAYVCSDGSLLIYRGTMETLDAGDHTLEVRYRQGDDTLSLSLTIHCIALADLEYDKATGANLVRGGLSGKVSLILGGGVQKKNYSLQRRTDTSTGEIVADATFAASYLATLDAGSYTYVATGNGGEDESFVVNVYDSQCSPSDAYLDYDSSATITYVRFACNCGKARHEYTLDESATPVTVYDFAAPIQGLDRNARHSVSVRCLTNNTRSKAFVIDTTSTGAAQYVANHYDYADKHPDYFISSSKELTDVFNYLASGGGDYDPYYGNNGMCSMTVFVGKGILTDGYNLQNLLNDALANFAAPVAGSSGLGDPVEQKVTLNADRSCELMAYYAFSSPLTKVTTSGMSPRNSADPRALLEEQDGKHVAAIENADKTQRVYSLQQLSTLPYDVRPIFDGDDVNVTHAANVYKAVLDVCHTYLSADMSDYEKVETFYHYLTTQVTYDDYSLLWFNLHVIASNSAGSKDKTQLDEEIDFYLEDARYQSESLQTALTSLRAMDFDQARSTIAYQLNCTSFDAYGAMIHKVAVCDGVSDAFYLLCWAENIPCQKVTGQASNTSSKENHAWNKVLIDDVWYVVDATWGRSTDKEHTFDVVTHQYCMVPDSAVSGNHYENGTNVLDATVYTVATATEYDYYQMTKVYGVDLAIEDWDDFETTVTAMHKHKKDMPMVEMRFDFAVSEDAVTTHLRSLNYSVQRVYHDGYLLLWFL